MKRILSASFCLLFALAACDDGGNSNNNTNNVNNTNNLNNINNVNNLNNASVCEPACADWQECVDTVCVPLEGLCADVSDCPSAAYTCTVEHQCVLECAPECTLYEECADVEGTPTCVQAQWLGWVHRPITIVDPIVNGTSLNMPIDGISWAYAPPAGGLITSYGRDIDDPNIAYVWHLNLETWEHTKKVLSGDLPPASENFCGGEDWCQLIGYDPASSMILVTGPRASSLMRIDPTTWATTLLATSGTRPNDSWISYTHVFDYAASKLHIFGHLGPAGFSSTLYTLDLGTGAWTSTALEVPQIYDNCLVVDSDTGLLYSFGGETTEDGGETSTPTAAFYTIDPINGDVTSGTMPEGIGARHALSCAAGGVIDGFFIHGGAVVNDYYNEALNVYYNDLWHYNQTTDTWTQVLAGTVPGTLEAPDQYGDQSFVGDPAIPNFGMNRGYMQPMAQFCGVAVIGAVPIFTHEQFYTIGLDPLCMGK